MFRYFSCIFFVACISSGLMCDHPVEPEIENAAAEIFIAQKNKEIPPKASDLIDNLDVDKAFQVQTVLVKKKSKHQSIRGFKGGLTSKAGQQRFNVDHPVAGVLFSEGKRNPGDTILFSDYNRMMVETELGYFLNTQIDQKIKSVEALKNLVEFVLPVLEFPNAAFGDNPDANDIISANVGSAFYIAGPIYAVQDHNINQISVTIHKGPTLLNAGKGSDAIGDQWDTLLWLINTMIDQGYVLGPDHLVITGALGKAFPGESGNYIADFEQLGRIEFSIL